MTNENWQKMTDERWQEIAAASKENPVRLTDDEVAEMRIENKHKLRHGIGAGRFVIPAKEGSPAAKALVLKDKGLNNAAIAAELGFTEKQITRVLERVHS